MLQTIGIRIPKVPQEVPVENDKPTATKNITAGKKLANPAAAPSITPLTYSAPPNKPVMFFKEVANVNIKIAGTIAMNPLGIHSIASLNDMDFLISK